MVLALEPDEVLERLPAAERASVEEFCARVRTGLGPRLKDLRLFGSKLRGDAHDESDIDLLVLVETRTEADSLFVRETAYAISNRLQPLVRDFDVYHAPASRATAFYEEMRSSSAKL